MTGVIVSPNFVVASDGQDFDANTPIIGYNNLVPDSTLTATTEDADFPVSNLANPLTHLRWKSGAGSPSTEEYLTVEFDPESSTPDIDYLAIARHNLGSSQATVSVEAAESSPGSPGDWTEVVGETLLPDDGPAIFRFTKQPYFGVRLRIQDSLAAAPATPYVSVMYVGALLLLQRRIYVGHTPMTMGRSQTVVNRRTINGDFAGRIVLAEKRETSISLKNLTPDWYRNYMDPFLKDALQNPFFFAWRPGDYPREAGFGWTVNDPQPTNQLANGMMQVDIDIEGVA